MAVKEYTSDSIQVLDDIEHIKLRRQMYIGEHTQDARQLLSEMIDNALDEVQSGYSDKIVVTVDNNKSEYTVRDFGRGIPHGLKTLDDGTKKETIAVLLSKANSGGKFDNSAYIVSSGLHGVGLTVTNALSDEIEIISYRKGKFVRGVANGTTDVNITYGESKEPDGTFVRFIPNKEYFNTTKISNKYVIDRCSVASALGFRAELYIDGKEVDTNAEMHDLIHEDEPAKVSTYVNSPVFEVKSSVGEIMKVALRYTSETNDRYFGYTNLLSNYLGGTHVQELSRTLTQAWIEFIDKHKNIKPSVDLRPNDYLVGLRAVCAVFISHPEFSSQTKEKLVVPRKYFTELMELFKKSFNKFLEENVVVAQQLIKRFEEYRIAQNQLLSRKEISSLIKINTDDSDNIRRRSIVSKLVDCTSRSRKGTEIFLCEGNSARGPFLFTRNVSTQAVLALRGKILNITGKSVKEAVKNAEICDIANSIGCGIGPSCDASKSRYEKVIISADADPDGQQITCLVLSVFVNMFPDMIKQGRVYIAEPPLYCWGDNPKNYGWCNKVEDVPKGVTATRFKGLGEMENSQLEYFLVNPETRNIKQVQYPSDVELFNKILGSSTGKRELLQQLGIIEEGR